MTNLDINEIVKRLHNIDLGNRVLSMKTGKAKGWLGEYHWVSLTQDPEVTDNTKSAVEWSTEMFGKSGARWFEKDKKFFFKDEKDMSMFILKWS